jgi:thiamine-phosphate pyrophosphorylase
MTNITGSLNHRPLLCLVTDRRRYAPGESNEQQLESVVTMVGAAAAAGVDLIQVRERDLSARTLETLVIRCLDIIKGTSTQLVVNDRLDVALGTGASGVHLREESFNVDRVRMRTPKGFLIGYSAHDLDGAVAASVYVDYIVLGTVYHSRSKPPSQKLLGVSALTHASRLTAVPILAIGGVTQDVLAEVAHSGAAGIAAIDLFVEAGRSQENRTLGITHLVNTVQEAFDRPKSLV